jgi:hypothetical protein
MTCRGGAAPDRFASRASGRIALCGNKTWQLRPPVIEHCRLCEQANPLVGQSDGTKCSRPMKVLGLVFGGGVAACGQVMQDSFVEGGERVEFSRGEQVDEVAADVRHVLGRRLLDGGATN